MNREPEGNDRVYFKTFNQLIFRAEGWNKVPLEATGSPVVVPRLEVQIREECFGDYSTCSTPMLAIHAFVWIPKVEVLKDSDGSAKMSVTVDGQTVTNWEVPLAKKGVVFAVQGQTLIEKPLPVPHNPFLLSVKCETPTPCLIQGEKRRFLVFANVVDVIRNGD